MEDFINNPLVVDFIIKAFNSAYNKNLCPEWIVFDKFKEETIKKLSIKLYNMCKGSWFYDKFVFGIEDLFQIRCNYYSVNLPLEIILLVIDFERYKSAKKLVKDESTFELPAAKKVIETYENDVKKRLDPYLCDDLIRIIIGYVRNI